MKIKYTHGLFIATGLQFNHIIEHPFTLEINGQTHFVTGDIFTECDTDGDVTDFCITLVDEDGYYTDEQAEEIDELLTETLRPQ